VPSLSVAGAPLGARECCCAWHLSDYRPPLHWSPVPTLCRFSSVHIRSLRFWPLRFLLSLRSFSLSWLRPISSLSLSSLFLLLSANGAFSFSDLGFRCFVMSIVRFVHSCFCPNEEHLVSPSFLRSLILYYVFLILVIGRESLHLYARTFGAA
jgi:hypothetical protein